MQRKGPWAKSPWLAINALTHHDLQEKRMIHFFFLIIPDIVITAETLFLTTIHQHQIEESLHNGKRKSMLFNYNDAWLLPDAVKTNGRGNLTLIFLSLKENLGLYKKEIYGLMSTACNIFSFITFALLFFWAKIRLEGSVSPRKTKFDSKKKPRRIH